MDGKEFERKEPNIAGPQIKALAIAHANDIWKCQCAPADFSVWLMQPGGDREISDADTVDLAHLSRPVFYTISSTSSCFVPAAKLR